MSSGVSYRKIEALQNLADRPGTEHEGKVARAMLEKLTGRAYAPTPPSPTPRPFVPRKPRAAKPPRPPLDFLKDDNARLKYATEIRDRFPIGTHVFYNAPNFKANRAGIVTGWKDFQVIVIFHDGFGAQRVPPRSARGWHLSKKKMDAKTSAKMRAKGARWA